MRFFNVMALLFPKFENVQKLRILVGAAIIFAYGCSDKMFDNAEEPPTEPQIERVKVLSKNLIKVSYTPTSTPNVYNADLTWPDFDGSIKILNSENKYLNYEPITKNNFTISNLQGGDESTYVIETYNLDQNVKRQIEIKLLPPKDLVVTGVLAARKNDSITYGRIFLTDGSKLFSNEFILQVNFNELVIGNNVEIGNFSVDQRAAIDTDGRNGGILQLRGKKITGQTRININGEHGGNGSEGQFRCYSDWDSTDCNGLSGKNAGARGRIEITLEESNENTFFPEPLFLDGTGGSAGRSSAQNGKTPSQKHFECADWLSKKNKPIPKPYCNVLPKNGAGVSNGGSICIKFNKDTDYECIEKN